MGTDLLPDEIDSNILKINDIQSNLEINFIGSITHIWYACRNICEFNNINFNHYGASFNINSKNNISIKENITYLNIK